MVKAVRSYEAGGPEVLRYEDIEVGEPGPGEAGIRHVAVGYEVTDSPPCHRKMARAGIMGDKPY